MVQAKRARNLFRLNYMTAELVLRGPQQMFAHNPKEISSFQSKLGLRHVPGKSAQWRR